MSDSKVPVMGTETEYGFYRQKEGAILIETYWDNEQMRKYGYWPKRSQEIGIFSDRLLSLWLFNGGKFYSDYGSTPEYCTPEVSSAMDVVAWEKAGDIIVKNILGLEGATKSEFLVLKHSRGRGASNKTADAFTGHHENFCLNISHEDFVKKIIRRETPENTQLINFLVSRIIISGAGYFVHDPEKTRHPFQVSARAAAIIHPVSSDTTSARGIVNTRDEPLVGGLNNNFCRLHLVVGESNMSEFSIFLASGTTAIVLRMILESTLLEDAPVLVNPVSAMNVFSSYPELNVTAGLSHKFNRKEVVTALEIQEYFCKKAEEFISRHEVRPWEEQVVFHWGECLKKLRINPRLLRGVLDWPTTLCLIEDFLKTEDHVLADLNGFNLAHMAEIKKARLLSLASKCSALDLAYRYLTHEGLYSRLLERGKIRRLISEDRIKECVAWAPADTRARVRGDMVRWLSEHQGWSGRVIDWDRVEICPSSSAISVPLLSFSLGFPLDSVCEKWDSFKEVSR